MATRTPKTLAHKAVSDQAEAARTNAARFRTDALKADEQAKLYRSKADGQDALAEALEELLK